MPLTDQSNSCPTYWVSIVEIVSAAVEWESGMTRTVDCLDYTTLLEGIFYPNE